MDSITFIVLMLENCTVFLFETERVVVGKLTMRSDMISKLCSKSFWSGAEKEIMSFKKYGEHIYIRSLNLVISSFRNLHAGSEQREGVALSLSFHE